jgi:hypothetical protein
MEEYYFKYGYIEKLHMIEEILINLIYYNSINIKENKLLPRWLYFNNGETYEIFCKLLKFEKLIKKDINLFIKNSIKELKIEKI